MKKFRVLIKSACVIIFAFLLIQLSFLSGCSRVIRDAKDELVLYSWSREFDTGSSMSLNFSDNFATLDFITSDGIKSSLYGLYILSPTNLVICDDNTGTDYTFLYSVYGDRVELTMDDSTIELYKDN